MKRLSAARREWFLRKSAWGIQRLSKNNRKPKPTFEINLAKQRFDAAIRALPVVPERTLKGSRLVVTEAPTKFSFLDNYEQSLAFVLELRRLYAKKRGRASLTRNISRQWLRLIDLARIEDIDPAAGLVLAAELDVLFKDARHKRSRDDTWHDNVRSFFIEAGLFELLGIAPSDAQTKPPGGPARTVLKYRKGAQPDGEQADALRSELEEICGAKFGPKVAVNNALCEAMTNSRHHAYPPTQEWWPARPEPLWWATCAWTPSTSTMHMVLYDQGVGIPATLPRSRHWATTMPLMQRLDPESTDAGLIEAALELRRTSTNIEGRGRGLYEMAEWIDKTKSGFLRIWSGKGVVTYRPGREVEKRHLPVPFSGTLIEWEVQHGN